MFTKNADVTYPFIIGMLLAQFFMFAFGIIISRYTHIVSDVPNYMMFGAVMILCVFGSYCVQNSFEDVKIMFALGIMMIIFKKFGIPSAPIVLGIILGPLAEENFLKGSLIANTDVGVWNYFFTGTINLTLIGLSALSLGYAVFSEIKHARRMKMRSNAANKETGNV